MGKRSKTGVLKRMREVKKQERAAMKQAQIQERRDSPTAAPEDMVATEDDMAGYGFPVADDEDSDDR